MQLYSHNIGAGPKYLRFIPSDPGSYDRKPSRAHPYPSGLNYDESRAEITTTVNKRRDEETVPGQVLLPTWERHRDKAVQTGGAARSQREDNYGDCE